MFWDGKGALSWMHRVEAEESFGRFNGLTDETPISGNGHPEVLSHGIEPDDTGG